MSRVVDALIAYRLLKLLVTPFNKTKAYQMGIIDDKGKVLIKKRDFARKIPSNKRAEAINSYTLLIRFVFNLKRLLSKVGVRGPLGSAAAAAIAFFREENQYNPEIENGDGISHKRDGGLKIEFNWEKQDNNQFKVFANLK